MGEVTRAEALKDYRYIDSTEAVIEAYQMNEHTLFDEKGWPPWLHMQKNKGQQNVLYRDMAEPMSLFINMSGAEGQLGLNAWIIVGPDGELSVMGEIEFGQYYNKVVAVPEVVQTAPADGQTDQEFYDSLSPKLIKKMGLIDPSTRDPHRGPPGAPTPAAQTAQVVAPTANDTVEVEVLRQQMKIAIECLTGGASKGAIRASQHLQVGLDTATEGGPQWCECAPGSCDESTKWGCRIKSPLL